ncbi:MAG: hypothetical protein WAT79_03470 [Saprospiraceae bacterium]
MKAYQGLMMLCFTIFMMACKNDTSKTEASKTEANMPTNPADLDIPSSCSLITIEWLKANLGLEGKDITIKDASDPTKKDYTSCFFKWVNSEYEPDAGILIQVMINPVYDEFPEWVTKFISAKITDGENTVDGSAPIRYSPFKAGVEGAYSYAMKRFYWRNDDRYLYMLAFNIGDSEPELVAKAEKIVTEINKNFDGK